MKQFKCGEGLAFYNIDDAVDMAFGHTLHRTHLPEHQVLKWFNALEIGEILFDEDGDEWTRVA